MPQARYRLVDTQTTPYYHCVSRCVRRAFLCGFDRSTGKNFDHRKQWIRDRVKHLSSVFAIDVCAYAIMSNHYHLVLHVDTEAPGQWSAEEVIERWLKLFKGPPVVRKHRAKEPLTLVEQDALASWIEVWRDRLGDLSWYKRCLNEVIARMANAEDNCSGRFWEGRFRSQALLDEAALISCMAYVDLNPIRASLCKTLESSEFTSIQERLLRLNRNQSGKGRVSWLKPLRDKGVRVNNAIPLRLTDYFVLVDWTGRAIRRDKPGAIPADVKPILQRLGVAQENWVTNTQHFGSRFYRALGRINQIKRLARRSGQRWINGLAQAGAFYH
ncbi:MAG: transposase [Pseudohongiellaceae bacterium]